MSFLDGIGDSIGGALKGVAGGAVAEAGSWATGAISSATGLDPSLVRMAGSGLLAGAANALGGSGNPAVGFLTNTLLNGAGLNMDWRVRVTIPFGAPYFWNKFQYPQVLFPLVESGGVVFPYTPQISVTHSARYQTQSLTHSNYNSYFYEGSEIQAITITGEFTAQNKDEAQYVIAAVQFFRAATKMFFGIGPQAGNPPPVVFLDGYGDWYFPHVTCVVTNFQHTMPQEVDYISIPNINFGFVDNWVPTTSTMSVTLQPVVSRQKLATGFDLNKFAGGGYMNNKDGGSFI